MSGVPYASLIDQAAAENGLDPAVLAGLVKQESGFDPSATSGAGAQGLTQLMPGTASSLGVSEPLDPAQSIAGGARYLGDLSASSAGTSPTPSPPTTPDPAPSSSTEACRRTRKPSST